jgi:hypothetical protein
MAIEHPDRVLSLVSMMSTTGNVSVGQAHADTLRQLFGGPLATTRDEAVERAVRAMSVIGSPAFPPDLEGVADRAGRAFDRDHDPVAVARQGVASVASGDRTDRLRTLRVPTLVVHGVDDTLCDVSGARATAAAVPGAELVLIDGMGHELPRELWPRIADLIAGAVRRGPPGIRAPLRSRIDAVPMLRPRDGPPIRRPDRRADASRVIAGTPRESTGVRRPRRRDDDQPQRPHRHVRRRVRRLRGLG